MNKQREEFIKEFKNCGFDFSIDLVPIGGIVQVEYVFSNQYTEGFYWGWQQAKKVTIPEGHVIVPREPTEKMIDAVDPFSHVEDIYRAMIEVADVEN